MTQRWDMAASSHLLGDTGSHPRLSPCLRVITDNVPLAGLETNTCGIRGILVSSRPGCLIGHNILLALNLFPRGCSTVGQSCFFSPFFLQVRPRVDE